MARSTAEAWRELETAWIAELGPLDDVPLSTAGKQILLAIARFESGFGDSTYANGAPTEDNWGAIHCPGKLGEQRTEPREGELWTHCVLGTDTGKGGRYDVYFRGYPDALTGARDFLRVVRSRGASGPAFDRGDAQAVATQMYDGYYFRAKKGETRADAIARYAEAIEANAAAVAKALGEEPAVFRGAGIDVVTVPSLAGVVATAAAGLAVLVVAVLVAKRRRR